MTNFIYFKGIEALGNGEIDWVDNTIQAILIDLDDYGTAVTAATNATPIVITANSHGLSDGDIVIITGVGGNTAANGLRKVANSDANTFELTDPSTGSNIAGNGAYTSGGRVIDITNDQYISDVPAAAREETVSLASKTNVNGVLDAADATFSSATGDVCEALIIAKSTGTDSTSPLLIFIEDVAAGLPVTPNGGDIEVQWSSGNDKILNLSGYTVG